MQNNQVSRTAYTSAYARLIEQYQPKEKRLFEDPYVKTFFSSYLSNFLKFRTYREFQVFMYNLSLTGIYGLQVCRTKYIDDLVKKALDNGIDQLVILGAGFDTRSFRILEGNRVKIFEIDLPEIQDKKKLMLKKHIEILPDNIIYIPIDFNTQLLDVSLMDKGLNYSKPIFFIWEGVTQYITEQAVDKTLKFISNAAQGSEVVFTYVLKSFIDGSENNQTANTMISLLKADNNPFCFGLNPSDTTSFLSQYKLTLIEDVGKLYFQENYLKPLERNLDISPIERLVYAKIN